MGMGGEKGGKDHGLSQTRAPDLRLNQSSPPLAGTLVLGARDSGLDYLSPLIPNHLGYVLKCRPRSPFSNLAIFSRVRILHPDCHVPSGAGAHEHLRLPPIMCNLELPLAGSVSEPRAREKLEDCVMKE